jgi:hypothetical protein
MAAQLMSQVCFLLAYKSQGGLLLHAAGVSSGRNGIILAGKSGAGKSTLAAWLVGNGLSYLSDELVYIPEHKAVINGFPRPITIKSPAPDFMKDLLNRKKLTTDMMQSDSLDIIDPVMLDATIEQDDVPLRVIIFPKYKKANIVELVEITKAQAAFKLMQSLANARNLAGHGFKETARVANQAPAYLLTYGETPGAGRKLLQLIETE